MGHITHHNMVLIVDKKPMGRLLLEDLAEGEHVQAGLVIPGGVSAHERLDCIRKKRRVTHSRTASREQIAVWVLVGQTTQSGRQKSSTPYLQNQRWIRMLHTTP